VYAFLISLISTTCPVRLARFNYPSRPSI
jgi:hypothetical protein